MISRKTKSHKKVKKKNREGEVFLKNIYICLEKKGFQSFEEKKIIFLCLENKFFFSQNNLFLRNAVYI